MFDTNFERSNTDDDGIVALNHMLSLAAVAERSGRCIKFVSLSVDGFQSVRQDGLFLVALHVWVDGSVEVILCPPIGPSLTYSFPPDQFCAIDIIRLWSRQPPVQNLN